MASDGLLVLADRTKLDEYVGPLSNAIVPVWDGTTGLPYKITADNIFIGSDDVLTQVAATEGDTTNIPGLHDKTMKYAFRAGGFAGKIVPGNAPGVAQVGWDNTNNDLTCPPGQPWTGGEILTIIHKP